MSGEKLMIHQLSEGVSILLPDSVSDFRQIESGSWSYTLTAKTSFIQDPLIGPTMVLERHINLPHKEIGAVVVCGPSYISVLYSSASGTALTLHYQNDGNFILLMSTATVMRRHLHQRKTVLQRNEEVLCTISNVAHISKSIYKPKVRVLGGPLLQDIHRTTALHKQLKEMLR